VVGFPGVRPFHSWCRKKWETQADGRSLRSGLVFGIPHRFLALLLRPLTRTTTKKKINEETGPKRN
jgi:hypothetical protein